MKSINNIHTLLLALCVLLGFSACEEKEADYDRTKPTTETQVAYFHNLAATIELSEVDHFFEVTVKRTKSDDALSIDLISTDTSGIFNIPKTIEFQAGADQTTVKITYKLEDITLGEYNEISLEIPDEYSFYYGEGSQKYTFLAGIGWKPVGKGRIAENYFLGVIQEVEIQKHTTVSNKYRIISPFNAGYDIEFMILEKGSKYKDVTVQTPGLVVYNNIYIVFHPSYNEPVYGLHPSNFTSLGAEKHWLFNKVKEYKEDGKTPKLIQLAPYYYLFGQQGGWNNTQNDNIILIEMP